MYTVWHVDKYKITFKLVINHWTNEILQHIVVSSGLSRPGIIDSRARYRTAARRLRNIGLDDRRSGVRSLTRKVFSFTTRPDRPWGSRPSIHTEVSGQEVKLVTDLNLVPIVRSYTSTPAYVFGHPAYVRPLSYLLNCRFVET